MNTGGGSRCPGCQRRCYSRPDRRGGERGLTLLEVMVTVALLAIGVVGITAGVASSEKVANTSQNQSQLQLAMRKLADFVRDSNPTIGLTYSPCAQATTPVTASSPGTGTYQVPLTKPSGVSQWGFVHVYESKLGTAFHDGQATFPKDGMCAAGTGDWGVQEIQLAVFGGGSAVTRTVWKSDAWCYNAGASPPQC